MNKKQMEQKENKCWDSINLNTNIIKLNANGLTTAIKRQWLVDWTKTKARPNYINYMLFTRTCLRKTTLKRYDTYKSKVEGG